MRTTWNFFTAGQLSFGLGAVRKLGTLFAQRELRRPLIISDPQLAAAGLIDRVRQPLQAAGMQVGVFDGGEPEPSLDVALRSAEVARRFQPDAIIGLGGGSNLDLAKMTAVLLTHGGEPAQYFSFDNVPGPVTPLACIPTTAGTGSEVSHAAVLTDAENEIKVSTLSRFLRPQLAVVDPELTVSCPPRATAESGIDALTHAIEAYTAVDWPALDIPDDQTAPYDGKQPIADVLAERAIELIGRHLPTAVHQPKNIEARQGMALAATLAGMAFSNAAVAVVHALEYPLGGTLHCSHGAGNGLLLPYVMRFNLPERVDELATIARLLGAETGGLEQQPAAELAITQVEALKREIGIPERISDVGGTAEQLPHFARKSAGITRLMQLNPRRPSEEDLLAILQSAL